MFISDLHLRFPCVLYGKMWGQEISRFIDSIFSALLSALFRSTDLVPSDVVAGCVLLRVRQKRETREMRRIQMLNDEEPIYTTDVNKIFSETPPWMNLKDALHYLRLSIAAYGWPYVLYRHCFTGFCKLARHLTCCCCRYVVYLRL